MSDWDREFLANLVQTLGPFAAIVAVAWYLGIL
jgi:hypothetical protein